MAEKKQISLMMRTIKKFRSSVEESDDFTLKDLTRQRKSMELFSHLASYEIGVFIEKFYAGDMEAEHILPYGYKSRGKSIVYCHGGGYTCGGIGYARILGSKLAVSTGMSVFTFAYRLAPEHKYPAALFDALRFRKMLMKNGYNPQNMIFAGDSAGGNLALEMCLELKAGKEVLPCGIVLFSPWTDMTLTAPSYEEWKDADPMVTRHYVENVRKAFLGEDVKDFANPAYSPLYGDLSGLPPTLVQVGSNEVLRCDSEYLVKKINEQGGRAYLQVYEGGWHVFQQMPVPLAVRALNRVGSFTARLARHKDKPGT